MIPGRGMTETPEEGDWELRADLKSRVSHTKNSSENVASHQNE